MSVWGVSRAYYTAKKHMSLDGEARMIDDYRKNPAEVISKLLGSKTSDLPDAANLAKPIAAPIALTITEDFKNLRTYKVRRVPHVVLIDKAGRVRLVEEAGQPDGGFQSRLLEHLIRKLAVE